MTLRESTCGMIKVNKKRASEETSIFIVNYSRYQVIGTSKRTSEEQVRNKSGTSGEQVEHIYKNNKECIRMIKKEKKSLRRFLFRMMMTLRESTCGMIDRRRNGDI